MKSMKPFKLRRWQVQIGPPANRLTTYFFTCARPGRTGDPATKDASVPDEIVHRWVLGLARLTGPAIAIVSLLGCKPDGRSEFSLYSFCEGFDSASEHPSRPSFQEWLDRWHGELAIWVREHPTLDLQRIAPAILSAIASDVNELLVEGRTVVLVDSDGQTRTGMVCRYINAVEVSMRLRGYEVVHSANIPAHSLESKFHKAVGTGAHLRSSVGPSLIAHDEKREPGRQEMSREHDRESLYISCSAHGYLSPHAIEKVLAKFEIAKNDFMQAWSKFTGRAESGAEQCDSIPAMSVGFSELMDQCFYVSCEPVTEQPSFVLVESVSNPWLSGRMVRQRTYRPIVRFTRRASSPWQKEPFSR